MGSEGDKLAVGKARVAHFRWVGCEDTGEGGARQKHGKTRVSMSRRAGCTSLEI